MKIIPDTNKFIDFWKHPTDDVRKIFEEQEIIICGVIRAELLQGAVSAKDFNEIVSGLDSFQEVDLVMDDWNRLGENLYLLRIKGITVSLADAIIATVAIKYGLSVWTNDKHFIMMKNILSGLEVFD